MKRRRRARKRRFWEVLGLDVGRGLSEAAKTRVTRKLEREVASCDVKRRERSKFRKMRRDDCDVEI